MDSNVQCPGLTNRDHLLIVSSKRWISIKFRETEPRHITLSQIYLLMLDHPVQQTLNLANFVQDINEPRNVMSMGPRRDRYHASSLQD
jgi:hypothetical protein